MLNKSKRFKLGEKYFKIIFSHSRRWRLKIIRQIFANLCKAYTAQQFSEVNVVKCLKKRAELFIELSRSFSKFFLYSQIRVF